MLLEALGESSASDTHVISVMVRVSQQSDCASKCGQGSD